MKTQCSGMYLLQVSVSQKKYYRVVHANEFLKRIIGY